MYHQIKTVFVTNNYKRSSCRIEVVNTASFFWCGSAEDLFSMGDEFLQEVDNIIIAEKGIFGVPYEYAYSEKDARAVRKRVTAKLKTLWPLKDLNHCFIHGIYDDFYSEEQLRSEVFMQTDHARKRKSLIFKTG